MDDVWQDSLMTGDQCAVCDGPLGDDAMILEDEGGALVHVCRTCAARQASVEAPAKPTPHEEVAPLVAPTPSYETPAEALAVLRGIRERRAEEHGMLSAVALLLERLADNLVDWQTRASTYEQHARSLEAELKRTRERLQRADELLATCAPPEPGAPRPSLSGPAIPVSTETGYPPEAPLTLEEVRLAQRYFNDSPHVEKLRSVRRGLGRPIVNLVRLAGSIPRYVVTAGWEIVWYQYVIDLGAEPTDEDRVTLHAEGMELGELLAHYKEPNASLDDHGRLDASELEVSLLSAESSLFTEMSDDEERALEDATEEIWDRHNMPEFRWDD